MKYADKVYFPKPQSYNRSLVYETNSEIMCKTCETRGPAIEKTFHVIWYNLGLSEIGILYVRYEVDQIRFSHFSICLKDREYMVPSLLWWTDGMHNITDKREGWGDTNVFPTYCCWTQARQSDCWNNCVLESHIEVNFCSTKFPAHHLHERKRLAWNQSKIGRSSAHSIT